MEYIIVVAGFVFAYLLGYVTPKQGRKDRLTDTALIDIMCREQNRYLNGR